MKLSIVIVNYKTPLLLMQCLASLKKEAPEVTDIIVVDNASNDETIPLLQSKHPDIKRIASKTNVGFGRGVNWGITNAKHEFVMILNPDVIVSPNSLQFLLKQIRADKNIGMIAPKLLLPNGEIQYSCCRFQSPDVIVYRRSVLGKTTLGQRRINHFLMKDYDHKEPRDVDWVIGGCMLIRRKAAEEVGLMDDRFFLYFEDMDWCRRLWQAGWRVRYEPRAIMTHYYRRQSNSQPGVKGLLTPLGRAHFISGTKYFIKHIGNSKRLKNGQKHLIK